MFGEGVSLQTKIKVVSVLLAILQLNTWCNVQRWEVVAYPLRGILLVDVATATPSPGEHGDSATDLPSKRFDRGQRSGPNERSGQRNLMQQLLWGDIPLIPSHNGSKSVKPLKATKGKAEPISTLLQP